MGLDIEINGVDFKRFNPAYNWVRTNVFEGNTNSATIVLDKEQTNSLIACVTEAIEAYKAGDIKKCKEIFPTKEGPFFGSVEYTICYLEECERLLKTLIPDTETKFWWWW